VAITVFSLKRHGGKHGYWKLGYIHITLSSQCRNSLLITDYLKKEKERNLGEKRTISLQSVKILQVMRRLTEQFMRALVDFFT